MPTSAATKFYSFTTDLTNGKHDFSAHAFKVMLTNVAPVVTNTAKANITEIAAGNGYTAGGAAVTVTKANASGVETLTITADVVWTPSGGAIASFRYVVLYNDTQTTPAKPLICWWDYGSSIAPAIGQPFTLDFDQVSGFATVGA
jgi:flagellar capping protein FliD